jgi:hypothetical protein
MLNWKNPAVMCNVAKKKYILYIYIMNHLEEVQRPVEEQQIQPDAAGGRSLCGEL